MTQNQSFHLTQQPDTVNWPETHYVFVEKIGPFPQSAPQAWQEAHKLIPAVGEHNTITGYMSLYKVAPPVYRAGVALAGPPVSLPAGMSYEKFPGGKYGRFVLTGAYSNLPEASGRVRDMVAEKHIPVRDGYNIENYINDPREVPEDKLVTEILFPAA